METKTNFSIPLFLYNATYDACDLTPIEALCYCANNPGIAAVCVH